MKFDFAIKFGISLQAFLTDIGRGIEALVCDIELSDLQFLGLMEYFSIRIMKLVFWDELSISVNAIKLGTFFGLRK